MNIDAGQYSSKVARSFMDNQTQDMGPNEEDGGSSLTEKTPASTSDGANLSRETPPEAKGGNLTLSATSANDPSTQPQPKQEPNFKQDLQRMKEMQGRVELPPDEVEEVKNQEVKLLDDGAVGIGFKSFEVLEILGNGAFGKVFKCKKKGCETEYAMKILKKAFLYRNKHLKYAITECNILKMADHPFVIKMHYSF